MQYCRLAKPLQGVSAKFMRCLYIAIAVPRMLDAADLFLMPEMPQNKGMKGFISKLRRIQWQVSLHIMG